MSKEFVGRASLVAQMVKCLSAMWETRVWSLGWQDLLEKEMAAHSSILAWKIPRTEDTGSLQSTGSQQSDTTEQLHFHFHFQEICIFLLNVFKNFKVDSFSLFILEYQLKLCYTSPYCPTDHWGSVQFSSLQFSCSDVSDSLRPHGL